MAGRNYVKEEKSRRGSRPGPAEISGSAVKNEEELRMQITEIRVYPRDEEKLKAFVTVTFDDAFVVRNLKVIQTKDNLFVAMPSRKMADGTHKDIAHPINNETRKHIEEKVLAAYKQKMSEGDSENKSAPAKTEFGGGGKPTAGAEDKEK